jgi:hypothetical protein
MSTREIYGNAVALALALSLLSYALSVASPTVLAHSARSMVANAVGASASVPPNEYNTLAQQLNAWQNSLDERETAMEQRMLSAERAMTLAVASIAVSAALFFLVGINFYLDVRRRRSAEDRSNALAIDLRRS